MPDAFKKVRRDSPEPLSFTLSSSCIRCLLLELPIAIWRLPICDCGLAKKPSESAIGNWQSLGFLSEFKFVAAAWAEPWRVRRYAADLAVVKDVVQLTVFD